MKQTRQQRRRGQQRLRTIQNKYSNTLITSFIIRQEAMLHWLVWAAKGDEVALQVCLGIKAFFTRPEEDIPVCGCCPAEVPSEPRALFIALHDREHHCIATAICPKCASSLSDDAIHATCMRHLEKIVGPIRELDPSNYQPESGGTA